MHKKYRNFVLDSLKDNLPIDSIDDYVEYWHTHEMEESLKDFLGFTEYEYENWLRKGNEVIKDILHCRKYKLSLVDYYKGKENNMFENIEKIIRQSGKLRIEEESYFSNIIVCIDVFGTINNATNEKDATIYYKGTEVYDIVDIASGSLDERTVDAQDKLETFSKTHPEFLCAKGPTLEDALNELESRAELWNRLDGESQDKILLDFIEHVNELLIQFCRR